MAAYAATICFKQFLKQLLDSGELSFPLPKPQIEFLYENVSSLQSSLDKILFIPKGKRRDTKELQSKIRDTIYAAEAEVDYSITNHSAHNSSLNEIADNIGFLAEEAELMAENISDYLRSQNLFFDNNTKFSSRGKETIVGQEKDFETISELLNSDEKQRLVIPITGLPGLGKTTLARNIYESRQAKHDFNIRAWVTVSQDYNFQEIFSKILSSMESKNYQAGHYAMQGDERTLFNRVHQELYNLKYLIVVDDVWDSTAWDRISLALPDKENGSRILLTSRIRKVVESIQKNGFIHTMKPLGLEDSWKLLCYKVFDVTDEVDEITDSCPLHLRETGRSIAEKCKGLPLSLSVVGGLLLQERDRLEYWKMIEEDVVDAAAAKGEDDNMSYLAMSYISMPVTLKGCFLYMGAFPEDAEIRVSKLNKLLVAAGFITLSEGDTGLELKAEEFLGDLVGRNMISVRKKSASGGMKVCVMNDSLRELAEREGIKEQLFHSWKKYNQQREEDLENRTGVSVHNNLLMSLKEVYDKTRLIKSPRSLLYLGPHHHHPLPFCLTFNLLRVLDAFTLYFIHFPYDVLDLIHLRYLALTYNHEIPPKISQLQRLQTLMVRREPKIIFIGVSFLPDEIWKMPDLRHVWLTETDFPALPPSPPEIALLPNLQTLTNVNAAYFTDEVLHNMPSLKKLSMWLESPDTINFNVSKLKQLERFKFVVLNPVPRKGIVVEAESFFAKTLKRVSLSGCGLPWTYMEYVGENLLDLEVLKLKELAFYGDEWILTYKLDQLKYLLIEYLNFQKWEAEESNFPRLERLILRHCYELEEIPQDLGFIGPLELVELKDCSHDAVESANVIREEQEIFEKRDFQVRIITSCN